MRPELIRFTWRESMQVLGSGPMYLSHRRELFNRRSGCRGSYEESVCLISQEFNRYPNCVLPRVRLDFVAIHSEPSAGYKRFTRACLSLADTTTEFSSACDQSKQLSRKRCPTGGAPSRPLKRFVVPPSGGIPTGILLITADESFETIRNRATYEVIAVRDSA